MLLADVVLTPVQPAGADLRSAVEVHRQLSEEEFPDLAVGLLHGRLSSAEKQAAIGAFASAFVPLFNRHMTEGESEAKRFAGEVLAVLLPILVVFGALMMLAMPWVLWAFANEDLRGDAATYDLAVAKK